MYYPEYEKVNAFVARANDLLSTSKTMEDIFVDSMKVNEKETAVEYIDEKGKIKSYEYSKMRSHAYADASVLSNFLCQKPKHLPIILKLSNGPHWGEIFWAILMCGYKPLLVDAKTTKEGTQNLIDQSKAIAIISDDAYQYSVLKICFDDILEENHHYSFTPEWENEVIFCSSGTTGDVKLMIFNGENLVNQICCSINMPKETKDIMYPPKLGKLKILAMIPFHHIFGFVAVFLWYTFYGKTIVFPATNAPSDIQSMCQKCAVTHIYSVPLFWDSLAQTIERKIALLGPTKQQLLDKMIGFNTGKITASQAGFASTGLFRDSVQKMLLGKQVRYCISGGGFLSRKTLTTINGIGYNLYNGYGMTELGVTSVELSPNVEDRLKGNIGHPLNNVEYKIANDAKEGELLVKSPTTHIREIIGGVEKPVELDDGFFHTGDIASRDATGDYAIKGRIKDIIINASGENIFPDELEIFFKNLPHVTQLSVLGIAKKNSQDEDIVLVLEVDNNVKDEDLKDIENKVREIRLPHDVKIDKIFLAKGKLPLANNMKVKRFVIKKAIENRSKDYVLINAKKQAKSFEGFKPEEIEDVLVQMREIFSQILFLPLFKIDDEGHWINDLGGDSMSYVELIRTVQDKFEITIPEEKYGLLTCVNDFAYEVALLLKDKPQKEEINDKK